MLAGDGNGRFCANLKFALSKKNRIVGVMQDVAVAPGFGPAGPLTAGRRFTSLPRRWPELLPLVHVVSAELYRTDGRPN